MAALCCLQEPWVFGLGNSIAHPTSLSPPCSRWSSCYTDFLPGPRLQTPQASLASTLPTPSACRAFSGWPVPAFTLHWLKCHLLRIPDDSLQSRSHKPLPYSLSYSYHAYIFHSHLSKYLLLGYCQFHKGMYTTYGQQRPCPCACC